MTSTTSSFKTGFAEGKGIFLWTLRRGRGILILNVALQFLLFPFLTFLVLQGARGEYQSNTYQQELYTLEEYLCSSFSSKAQAAAYAALLLGIALCFILCAFLFGYLHQKRSVDLMHAMPVRRVPMLLGKYFAGLVILWLPVIVCVLLDFLTAMLMGAASVPNFPGFLTQTLLPFFAWDIVMIGVCLAFFMFFAVCCGTLLDTMISVVAINVFYPMLLGLLWSNAADQIPGFPVRSVGSGGVLDILMQIGSPLFAGAATPMIKGMSLLMLAVGIVLVIASCLLYRRRKSECAESSFAFPLPKYIICFVATAASALLAGQVFLSVNNTTANYFAGLIIGSVLAHIISEAIYSRGFKGLKKSFKAYGVFAVVFLIGYVSIVTGFYGYDTRIPQASEVESVDVYIPTGYISQGYSDTFSFNIQEVEMDSDGRGYTSVRSLRTMEHTLRDPESIEKTIAFHQAVVDQYRETLYPYLRPQSRYYKDITLTYHMKDGSEFRRIFSSRIYKELVGDTPAEQRLLDLFNLLEYRTSGNYLYYVEPDCFTEIYVELPDTETIDTSLVVGEYGAAARTEEIPGITLIPSREQKEQLLEAIRQDIDEMQVTQTDLPNLGDEIWISIDFTNPIIPQGEALKEFLGDTYTQGTRVIFSEGFNCYLGGNYPRTTEVIESMLQDVD